MGGAFDDAVAALTDMGFQPAERCYAALEASGGDVGMATERLLNHAATDGPDGG